MLMKAAGIPSEYVTGYAEGSHAWNIIQIDGAWYHVDTTWDDPTNKGGDYIRYDYFLKSDTYMRRDHSNWTASHTCTSTKYDGLDLPNTEEQDQQAQDNQTQQQVQQQQQTIAAFLELCYTSIENLPYQTQAELESATDEALYEAYRQEIQLPADQLSREALYLFWEKAREEIPARYPDIRVASLDTSAPSLLIYRDDVKREQERRQALQQAEKAARIAAIESLLQQAVRETANIDQGTVTITGYTDAEIRQACKNMNAAGYSFDGYTSDDYSVSYSTAGKVTIKNQKWIDEEIQRYVALLETGIRNGETQIVLPAGSYVGQKPTYYAYRAGVEIQRAGYTVGDLVAGTDYTVSRTFIRAATNEYVVEIQYLDSAAA